MDAPPRMNRRDVYTPPADPLKVSEPPPLGDDAPMDEALTLAGFARTADAIAATGSKLAKVGLLAGHLQALDPSRLMLGSRYFAGRVFPPGDPRTLNVGGAALHKVLVEVAGVAAIAAAKGPRGREASLAELLSQCSPAEAKYLVKLTTGDLRIGLREGLVEEAIRVAFHRPAADVARAVMLLGDLGQVACLVARGEREGRAGHFAPLRFMLASPVADAEEAVRRMGDDVWVEDKYDGIRCQLLHTGGRVALYSRDLNDVTEQFPEVTAAAAHVPDVILDGEILAFSGGRVLPFHDLQTRLGRRNPSAAMLESVPVIYVAWDLLLLGDESLLDVSLRDRRRRLEALALGSGFALAHLEPAVGAAAVDERFAAARERRNEGLMLKDPESAYTPGRRGMAWLKLKRPLDTLDVVVVGAEWGHGKRRGVLSDVTFAVRDDTGELV